MQKYFLLTKVLVLFLYTSAAHAEVLFEGYFKLTMASQHIGYFIQRYELDGTAKTFSSTYFLFTKTADGTTTESLSAKSTSKLEPLEYKYSRLEGNSIKAIDAIIKKTGKTSKLVIKTVENGKPPRVTEVPLNDRVFLSTFLSYLILKNPQGLQVGSKFTYDAIAEEDGQVEKGEVYVKEQVKEKGIDTFRTLNTFKKEEFVNWIDSKGDSIKTLVPKLNLQAELVSNPKDAYLSMPFSESIIKTLFGNIPEGKKNLLSGK
jgi:hypothetical protein